MARVIRALSVAEKPSVAKEVARILNGGDPVRLWGPLRRTAAPRFGSPPQIDGHPPPPLQTSHAGFSRFNRIFDVRCQILRGERRGQALLFNNLKLLAPYLVAHARCLL